MDKCILVQYLTSINSVISEIFKSTQRIKLTCFDVSEEYIVFGTSSGGVYIFKREPCQFIKIIPSKEGSAIKIVIAPKGKNLAIASSKGLLIILEDFLDINVRPLIHSEHEGSMVTAIKWYGNTVYSGDDAGRVAVFSLSNLLTIFQTASATIMHLDSNIVQIDSYLNYLLISTKTRTYLCDTEKECYKQIGKKMRDGNFGACFFNVANNDSPDTYQSIKGIFKTIKENESFMTTLNNSDVKIYCARPGVRLWEANFEATVLVTHQFRDSLNQNPSDILHLEDVEDARMTVHTYRDINGYSKGFNFGLIYPVLSRFVFSHDNEGIYFFDPTTSKLAFWSNCFKNIKHVIILGSVLYVWQDNSQISVISLELLEELIIKTLLNKQYYFCSELCINYFDDVISLIEHSRKIHLISILKSKLVAANATELLEKLMPVLQRLEKFNKKTTLGKKLSNGIVIIENSHVEAIDYDMYIPESVKNFKNSSSSKEDKCITDDMKETLTCNPLVKELTAHLTQSKNAQDEKTLSEENPNLLALYKQFKLNKTHKTVELTESSDLMNEMSLEDLIILFQDFIKYIEKIENTDATTWCKEQFLKQASRRNFDIKTMDTNTLLFLQDAFLELCNSRHFSCRCHFPLPKASKKCPQYYHLGYKLLDHCENVNAYLINVPYMHKYVLSRIKKLNDALSNLPLIVQFNDEELFESFKMIFTYDTWDEIIKLHIKLRKGNCLNCEESIELDGICSWSSLGILMIKSIGPQNTTRLLKRYSQYIPNGSLDTKFYQCSILASTFDQPDLAVNFLNNMVTEDTLPQFEDQMEKFLQRKYLGCQSQAIKCGNTTDAIKCTYCDTPLHGPILSDTKKCDSGHNFHSLCFARNKGICNVCSKT
ncbi:Hermansky-Pudlak syndrome 5 protein homolog isoform X1 [Anoplophora glabripennis]|uniref:Hermansky-Pudlak syndrome 5 protein homolog isoform X1 n=1 Tax=Anoplophora glabripennis TaxID=217634 RepID=UPI0008753498|nr:Hermansky-Pudlak syndrome 5 protein homolog isoform X1 [Anoplophora glabripennis]